MGPGLSGHAWSFGREDHREILLPLYSPGQLQTIGAEFRSTFPRTHFFRFRCALRSVIRSNSSEITTALHCLRIVGGFLPGTAFRCAFAFPEDRKGADK